MTAYSGCGSSSKPAESKRARTSTSETTVKQSTSSPNTTTDNSASNESNQSTQYQSGSSQPQLVVDADKQAYLTSEILELIFYSRFSRIAFNSAFSALLRKQGVLLKEVLSAVQEILNTHRPSNVLVYDVGVDLCGGDVLVAQGFLYHTEVCPAA